MAKRKKRAPVVERDPLANRVPARQRFRRAAELALDSLGDRSLNFWAWRIEGELMLTALCGLRSFDEISADELKQARQLLAAKRPAGKKADVLPIKRPSALKRERASRE